MVETKQIVPHSGEAVLLDVENISQSINRDDLQLLMDVINTEIGSRKLNNDDIEQLQSLMNVEALECAKWKTVADVLHHFSPSAIAENNPQGIKIAAEKVLGSLACYFPAAGAANMILGKVPDQMFATLVKVGGYASPDYLLYKGVDRFVTQKIKNAQIQAEYNAIEAEDMTTLFIVSKNKMLSAEMEKLIKLKDDTDDENIVGTKDGTVFPMIWAESAWEAYQDKLTEDDKVLLIGKVKNTMPLPTKGVHFDQFGVKYGWYNNIARIEVDPKALSNSKQYKEFLAVLNELDISEKMKKNAKVKAAWGTAAKLALFPPLALGDLFREDPEIIKQQLMFGIYSFYMDGLDEFLNETKA